MKFLRWIVVLLLIVMVIYFGLDKRPEIKPIRPNRVDETNHHYLSNSYHDKKDEQDDNQEVMELESNDENEINQETIKQDTISQETITDSNKENSETLPPPTNKVCYSVYVIDQNEVIESGHYEQIVIPAETLTKDIYEDYILIHFVRSDGSEIVLEKTESLNVDEYWMNNPEYERWYSTSQTRVVGQEVIVIKQEEVIEQYEIDQPYVAEVGHYETRCE